MISITVTEGTLKECILSADSLTNAIEDASSVSLFKERLREQDSSMLSLGQASKSSKKNQGVSPPQHLPRPQLFKHSTSQHRRMHQASALILSCWSRDTVCNGLATHAPFLPTEIFSPRNILISVPVDKIWGRQKLPWPWSCSSNYSLALLMPGEECVLLSLEESFRAPVAAAWCVSLLPAEKHCQLEYLSKDGSNFLLTHFMGE